MKNHYKTIVISDVHLGTKGSKAKEVTNFLKKNSCDKLILNGDIIDGWQLLKYGKWEKCHTQFFRRLLKCIEKNNTEVIYLRGNHDDFLDHLIPFKLGCISIRKDYILESGEKKYYVIHGDIFDSITTNLKWIAQLGDIGYTFLLWLNQLYNQYRAKRGLPYYSLSQVVKSKVKSAVSYVNKYENQLAELSQIKKCDGIICGHIHQPALKEIAGITYMNSGDWVETLSALVEHENSEWSIVYYNNEKDNDSIEETDDLNHEEFDLNKIIIQPQLAELQIISNFSL